MKLFLISLFLLFSAPLFAQLVQPFDIVSFSLASTWKKEAQQDWLAYRVENPAQKTYARILLYPSLPSSGNPETDFQKEWNDLIVSNYKPGQTIEESLSDYKDGWKAKIRVAPFVHNQVNQAVILLVLTDGKRKMSFVFLTNTEEFQKDFEDFGSSLKFASAPGQTPATVPSTNTSIIPAKVSATKAHVQIDQKLIGNWIISASVSSFSQMEGYVKKNELGSLKEKKSRAPEIVSYRFQFHFFEGIGERNLVLQADQATQRDRDFSSNITFPNAWYFDQRFTDLNLLL